MPEPSYVAETAWIDAHVDRTGEVEVRSVRPWATVWRAPTADGPVWMKAARSGTAFEVPLYALLAREVPDRVLTPIAVDVERSWLLLPDGGPSLGEREAGADALIEALGELACRVAKIARALTWVRALQATYEQGEPVDPDWATAPAETLARLLHDHYLA
jgi:hypothetical protein